MRKTRETKDYATLAAMLRKLRRDAGLKQSELALRLGTGTTQSLVSKCESGERRIDVLELRRWCQKLDVSFIGFVEALEEQLANRG